MTRSSSRAAAIPQQLDERSVPNRTPPYQHLSMYQPSRAANPDCSMTAVSIRIPATWMSIELPWLVAATVKLCYLRAWLADEVRMVPSTGSRDRPTSTRRSDRRRCTPCIIRYSKFIVGHLHNHMINETSNLVIQGTKVYSLTLNRRDVYREKGSHAPSQQ